jgi:hypothetical protein
MYSHYQKDRFPKSLKISENNKTKVLVNRKLFCNFTANTGRDECERLLMVVLPHSSFILKD